MNYKKPNEILKEAAETFEKKNKEYGSNWKNNAAVFCELFPKGIVLSDEDDFKRFQFLVMIIGKFTRYCNNFANGGHQDSIRDLIVYAAMLESCDESIKELDKFEDEIEEVSEKFFFQVRENKMTINADALGGVVKTPMPSLGRKIWDNDVKYPDCFGNKKGFAHMHCINCQCIDECIKETENKERIK